MQFMYKHIIYYIIKIKKDNNIEIVLCNPKNFSNIKF